MVSVDAKNIKLELNSHRALETSKSRGSPYGLCGRRATFNLNSTHTELRSRVKIEIVRMVSVDVKNIELELNSHRS